MIELQALRLEHPTSGAALLASGELTAAAGQVVVIAASPGAGSSLLMRTVLGERRPAGGTVRLFERDPHRLRAGALRRMRRRIGVVPQDLALVAGRSVRRQVALALELAGASRAATTLACGSVLDRLGLLADGDADPSTLAAAARARIGLARALVRQPDLIIADQPTALQDDLGVTLVATALADAAAAGATCLVLARDPRFDAEAVRLGMRRMIWHGGELVDHEALEIDIGSALDLILDARSAPIARRPRVPLPGVSAPNSAPVPSPHHPHHDVSNAIPNVLPFPISARTAGAS